jgi:hypothetical protein
MEGKRFEDLVRALTHGATRRGVLGTLAAVAGLRLTDGEGKRRHRDAGKRRKPAKGNHRGNARVSAEKNENGATPYHLPDECFPGPFPYETCVYDQRFLFHEQSTPSGKQHTHVKGQVCYRVEDPATGQFIEQYCDQVVSKGRFDPEKGSNLSFFHHETEQIINNFRFHGETIYRIKDSQYTLYQQCFTLTNLLTGEVEFEQCFDITEVTICHFDRRSGAYQKLVVSAKQAEQHFKQHEQDSYYGNCCADAECSGADCCAGFCTDKDADPFNCGACGAFCGEDESCQGGSCAPVVCAPPCGPDETCRVQAFPPYGGTCCRVRLGAEYGCNAGIPGIPGCAETGDCGFFVCELTCSFGGGSGVTAGVNCATAQPCATDDDCPDGVFCGASSCCGQSVCVPSCNADLF